MPTTDDVLTRLRSLARSDRLPGMARYGIATGNALGVTVAELRALARELPRDHGLAAGLWTSGIHEARILASMVDDAALVDDAQMERWAADFDSWDLCDQVCANLFRRTPQVWTKAVEWAGREELFVKRAGFALMAGLAVRGGHAPDHRLAGFLPVIARTADDARPLVRKAAGWALRSIGKRSAALNGPAIETAAALRAGGSGARWVGADALRELRSDAVRARLS